MDTGPIKIWFSKRDWAYISIAFVAGVLVATFSIYTFDEAYHYIVELQGIWAGLIGLIAALIAAQQITGQMAFNKAYKKAALAWELRVRFSSWSQFLRMADLYLDQPDSQLHPHQLEIPNISPEQRHEISALYGGKFLVDLMRLISSLDLYKKNVTELGNDQKTIAELKECAKNIYNVLYEACAYTDADKQ